MAPFSPQMAIVANQRGRDPTTWPFTTTSPWNLPVATTAVYQAVSAPQSNNLNDNSALTSINAENFSLPVYYAAITDPLASVTWIDAHDLSYTNRGTFQYRIPNGATPSGPFTGPNLGDFNMNVIDPGRRYVYETWLMQGANPTWQVGFYNKTDLLSDGLNTGGPRAYGGSTMGGLIRNFDIQAGVIRHALAMALDTTQLYAFTDGGGNCVGFVWPAVSQDMTACTSGSLYLGLNPMGTFAAIPPSVNINTMGLVTNAGRMLAKAAQDYGVYIVDRSGNNTDVFYGEQALSSAWLADLRSNFDMDRVRHALCVITNNSAATPNGGVYDPTGANRRAALAPSL